MILTPDEMRDAIYARMYDERSSVDELSASDRESLKRGKAILKKHTLRFAGRMTIYCMSDGTIPCENEGHSILRCEAGYIATAQAYDTAIFNHR